MIGKSISTLVLAIAAMAAPAQGATVRSVEAEGTGFKVELADGRVLRSPELVGAVLVVAQGDTTRRIRIDAVERDPRDTRADATAADRVWLHSLSVETTDGRWQSACAPGPDGRAQGFPLAGRAARDGSLHAVPGALELVCTAGAQGKCVRFGYHPWAGDLRPAYNACVHMVRGDYAGDDRPKTNNGMLIDIYDDIGVMTLDGDEGFAFEAGWGPDGAVCVHHPRVKANVTLEQLAAETPRLAGRTGAICTEEYARAHGALIFNRSKP